MHGAPTCLGSPDTPRVGGLGATMLLPPPHPGRSPGLKTCTDACRRVAGPGACCGTPRHPATRRQGGHV
jgi:hypothetical protein